MFIPSDTAKTKPKQTQSKPKQTQFKPNQTRSEFTPKGAKIPTGQLLGILKPGTNFKPGALHLNSFCFSLFFAQNIFSVSICIISNTDKVYYY